MIKRFLPLLYFVVLACHRYQTSASSENPTYKTIESLLADPDTVDKIAKDASASDLEFDEEAAELTNYEALLQRRIDVPENIDFGYIIDRALNSPEALLMSHSVKEIIKEVGQLSSLLSERSKTLLAVIAGAPKASHNLEEAFKFQNLFGETLRTLPNFEVLRTLVVELADKCEQYLSQTSEIIENYDQISNGFQPLKLEYDRIVKSYNPSLDEELTNYKLNIRTLLIVTKKALSNLLVLERKVTGVITKLGDSTPVAKEMVTVARKLFHIITTTDIDEEEGVETINLAEVKATLSKSNSGKGIIKTEDDYKRLWVLLNTMRLFAEKYLKDELPKKVVAKDEL